MNLIRAVVHNPVKVTVGVLLVALFGVVALMRMPLQLTPEVQRPTISVETRWPGASPQEIEREIIIEQEEQLKSVEGLVKLSSEATDSQGTVELEFHVGTDLQSVLLKVNSRLQQVREYPEDADQPVISTSNASDRPIAWFILSTRRPTEEMIVAFQSEHPELAEKLDRVRKAHNVGLAMLRLRLLADEHPVVREKLLLHEGIDVTKLRRFAEDEIEARFERVPGVSQSNVLGGLQDEMQVVVDPEKLAARQITIEDLRRVLRAQNKDTSAGDFWEGKRRWVVRTLGQFRSPEDVGNQLVAVRDDVPVYVRDVADIELGYRKPDGIVRRFGESSIAVNCIRETGANVLDVMDGLREMRAEIDEQILKPKGLQLVQVYDETEYIYSALDLVQQNIFIGGALTMIVLMLFLHLGIRTLAVIPLILVSALAAAFVSSWFFLVCLALLIGIGFWAARGALVVGLAIPTSIVGTFLILGLLGRSLNVVSLAGMAFAVGMLVDSAVVVLENVFRRFSEGEDAFDAAINGTSEVLGAVVASTLTTIAVFLPVVFVQEEAGQLFQDIALAITGAVGLSLVVSMTLISTASARLLHRDTDQRTTDQTNASGLGSIAGLMDSFGAAFVNAIISFNQWVQLGTFRRLLVTFGLVGFSIAGSWLFWPRVEYLPNGNRNLIFAILLPPPGYNLNQLMELGQTVESNLRPYWDAVPGSEEASRLDGPIIGDFFFVARGRSVFMGLRAYEGERAAEIIPLIRNATQQLPGTFAVASQSSLFADGLESSRTIDVEITGPDLHTLVALGGQIFGQVRGLLPPDTQSRPIPSLDLSSPEVHIQPHLIQAAEMGMSANELGYTANALIDGAYAGDYFIGGDKIDLTIKGRDERVRNAEDVRSLPIATPSGQLVPLGALAEVSMSSGPEQINHRERQRAITIQVTPPADMALEEAMIQIRDEIVRPIQASGQLDGGYQIVLAGTADKLNATWEALQFNVLLALLITYLLMAALFESWLYPFVIIFSVPLGAVGGVGGLQLLNQFILQPLDVLTMLGFVILIGTVVNNPILIVHQSLNLIREKGLTPRVAILESVRTRVRPIFMTTLTTVLGLLPLVLFPGAGSELYRGLGSVVLGGLLVSTIFTLVLVPTLFSLMLDARSLFTRTG
ncbi:MAG: efflux RND transporter permease subunit [Planctomycetota bacterium]|nr:efflux RND transporter permease subunit [Planctomycetota bacterium]